MWICLNNCTYNAKAAFTDGVSWYQDYSAIFALLLVAMVVFAFGHPKMSASTITDQHGVGQSEPRLRD